MTTFEMAQAAYENPGKVFVGKNDARILYCRVKWSPKGHIVRDCGDDIWNAIDPSAFQQEGWQWEEEKQPRKVEFSADVVYHHTVGTCDVASIACRLREEAGGHDAVKGTRWRVKVTAEEVL